MIIMIRQAIEQEMKTSILFLVVFGKQATPHGDGG